MTLTDNVKEMPDIKEVIKYGAIYMKLRKDTTKPVCGRDGKCKVSLREVTTKSGDGCLWQGRQ